MPGTHWIEVHLIGVKTNRAAIGAKIRVKLNGGQRYREVSSGGSFGSNPYTQHIGLGKASAIESIEITWPTSKTRQIFRNPPIDTLLEITEGVDVPVVRPRRPFKLGGADPAGHQH